MWADWRYVGDGSEEVDWKDVPPEQVLERINAVQDALVKTVGRGGLGVMLSAPGEKLCTWFRPDTPLTQRGMKIRHVQFQPYCLD